ncbi:hypothetical protein [Pseudomonas sp. RIT-To-2]|uniref:hypothetical protein n=1 Tax=Pseudomonas sp. RIT-To-2 TaxID=3462541 RepID=UPI0024138A9B
MHPDSLLSAFAIALLLGISLASAEPHTNWHDVLQVGLPLCMAGVVAVFYWLRRHQPRSQARKQVQPTRSLLMVWVNVRWEGVGRRNS